jgi:hypothetical protein
MLGWILDQGLVKPGAGHPNDLSPRWGSGPLPSVSIANNLLPRWGWVMLPLDDTAPEGRQLNSKTAMRKASEPRRGDISVASPKERKSGR